MLVEFYEKVYMNDKLFLRYTKYYLVRVLGGQPTLFAIEEMGSYKTPAVLQKLQSHSIILPLSLVTAQV